MIVKANENEDISKHVEQILDIYKRDKEQCGLRVKHAENVIQHYEAVRQDSGLSKKQQKKLTEAQKFVHTNAEGISKDAKKQVRNYIKKIVEKESVPIGAQNLTLTLTKDEYDLIDKHFNQATKKALAERVVAFILQGIGV